MHRWKRQKLKSGYCLLKFLSSFLWSSPVVWSLISRTKTKTWYWNTHRLHLKNIPTYLRWESLVWGQHCQRCIKDTHAATTDAIRFDSHPNLDAIKRTVIQPGFKSSPSLRRKSVNQNFPSNYFWGQSNIGIVKLNEQKNCPGSSTLLWRKRIL